MINPYFQSGLSIGRSSEQLLYEDLIIECLRVYGFDLYYIPRKQVNRDLILNEDALNRYEHAYKIEMYLSNVQGFEGEGDLLTKFGVELRDTANFIVSRRRWQEVVARQGQTVLSARPAEGDILFFPLTNSFFEIRRVEGTEPFFQVGKMYVFNMSCELVQYSSEVFNTGVNEIDSVFDELSLDVTSFQLQLEDGNKVLLEYTTNSHIILENFVLKDIDPFAMNKDFELEIDILDFTDRNPFGEVQYT